MFTRTSPGGSSKAPTLTYEQVAWYRNNLQTPYSLLVDAGDAHRARPSPP